MLEVADIFRCHSAAYRATHRLLPSQLRALQDIAACRTAYFGGHLKQCDLVQPSILSRLRATTILNSFGSVCPTHAAQADIPCVPG
jgi:Transposase zinc-binding domain